MLHQPRFTISETGQIHDNLTSAPDFSNWAETWREIRKSNKVARSQEIVYGLPACMGTGIVNCPPKAGRSTIMQLLTDALASGRPFPPFIARKQPPARVVYFDYSKPECETSAPLDPKYLESSEEIEFEPPVVIQWESPCEVEWFQYTRPLEDLEPNLIIIDSIQDAFPMFDDGDPIGFYQKVTWFLQQIAYTFESAVVATNTLSKRTRSEETEIRKIMSENCDLLLDVDPISNNEVLMSGPKFGSSTFRLKLDATVDNVLHPSLEALINGGK